MNVFNNANQERKKYPANSEQDKEQQKIMCWAAQEDEKRKQNTKKK